MFSIKATCGAIRGKLLVECLVQVIENLLRSSHRLRKVFGSYSHRIYLIKSHCCHTTGNQSCSPPQEMRGRLCVYVFPLLSTAWSHYFLGHLSESLEYFMFTEVFHSSSFTLSNKEIKLPSCSQKKKTNKNVIYSSFYWKVVEA